MSEIRVTSVVGENGGDRVGLTTGLTVGPLTGTTGIGATISHQGHAQFAGVCTATSFVGSGANLTGINTPTLAGGTMTIGFQDHVAGNTSSTTATGYYQRIGNMVFCAIDTGAINKSNLTSGEILLLTGCFPVTRDNNWTISGSCSHYNVNSGQNSGGPVVVPQKGYWLSNTSMYFTIPRNNSTADNLTVGMMSGNTARFFMNYSYKVA